MAAHRRRGSSAGFALSILGRSVALAAGSLSVGLLMWAVTPTLFGYRPNLVTSNSMRPTITEGDIVLTRTVDDTELTVGQVVLVEDPSRSTPYLHRIRSLDDDRIITQGDANPTADFPAVSAPEVRGAGELLVPRVGTPLIWVRANPGAAATALAGAFLVIVGRRAWRRTARSPQGNSQMSQMLRKI